MNKKNLSSTTPRSNKVVVDSSLSGLKQSLIDKNLKLPQHAGSLRHLRFSKFYGKGCDDIVVAIHKLLCDMIESGMSNDWKMYSPSTVASYYSTGVSSFVSFCISLASDMNKILKLSDINKELIRQYIVSLGSGNLSVASQRSIYKSAKSILVGIIEIGWIKKDIFPVNPYPNSSRECKGQPALSEAERRSVLKYLKYDMRNIVDKNGPLSSYDLSICILAIAARTGINPTPALELTIDCLQPHPIKDDRYMLVSFKRRGSGTHLDSLGHSSNIKSLSPALPDVARIIDHVKCRNSCYRDDSRFAGYLFVYKSRGSGNVGKICRLSKTTLDSGIKKFVAVHQIRNSEGQLINLNVMRLRKTFENRLFVLSGQDPFLTAKLGGHSVKISNDHYLVPHENAEKDWRIMGEIRTEELINYTEENSGVVKKTPVAGCQDTLYGDYAPKNGNHCQKFLTCFKCKSFIVTGDDLYRVYSFYWSLVRMRNEMKYSSWKKTYGSIIRVIDREISPQFSIDIVKLQRQRAKVDPHPFWKDVKWSGALE
ncbi:hypothetical protein FBG13_07050 [Cobetia marina]|uniref:hypothetical protein n=2 Tax=Halomonadaceae TaxID=28256 RepID=UPI000C5AC9D8|nr:MULTISPECIES: hypothetical protein [Cobetia]MBK10580.1 hypothetical protein [Cobetia sp.]TKD62723.1 hypothetical protein FBG13_07050 [Cobetia marina]|tara:strand:+ start:1305 stop:2921 length:1617 start_codon:yes stop_codon:yes gene_type:complete